jgi:hypothetical protein
MWKSVENQHDTDFKILIVKSMKALQHHANFTALEALIQEG